MKHEILINIRDGCPDEIESGLPKNWKLIFKDFSAGEDDKFARCNPDSEEESEKYYFEYVVSSCCGEVVAPKLLIYEFKRLHALVQDQVHVYGRQQFRSTLRALEKCLGY